MNKTLMPGVIENEYKEELTDEPGMSTRPIENILIPDLEIKERHEDFNRDVKLIQYYKRLVEKMRLNPQRFIY